MSGKRPRDRSLCLDFYADAWQRITAWGVAPGLIDRLKEYGLLADDNVTGFHEGRFGTARMATLKKAIEHVKRTGERILYVEMDLANLGGLNAALGHSRANEVFAKVAAVIRTELSAVAEAVFFRHGGDEMSAFLVGATEQELRRAFGRVRRGVVQLAREYGVEAVPHPKHPHEERLRGISVRFGISRVLARHEDDPTGVFRAADTEVERYKGTGCRRTEPVPLTRQGPPRELARISLVLEFVA